MHRQSGGDVLLQPQDFSHVAVAKLLDLDHASLFDLCNKLPHGVNISSHVSLRDLTVRWHLLKSFDKVCSVPRLISGRD